MDEERAKKMVHALVAGAKNLNEIARTAQRNRKSISSTGFYADRFHNESVKLAAVERATADVLQSIDGFDRDPLLRHLAVVKSTGASLKERETARRQIEMVCTADVLPNVGNLSSPSRSASESILPAAVLATAPTYLQRSLLQANGCYERRWFDAASVMVRKLVENLIIDVYERNGKADEIKKDGEYHMLAGLITAILNQSHWQLQRETKRELPEIKRLGDRAAHNRRYQATKQDIDQVRTGLRATVDDLLHLAHYK
jgi:hypothetical protein